ncbi:NOB1 protein, partial [Grallaria varia]|nr:NOB1 protein [Grallaria varia]
TRAAMARVPHVVADTGAFLSAAPLQDIAGALYTVPEVLAEIRDRPTRRRLAALPCELRVRRPRPDLLRLGGGGRGPADPRSVPQVLLSSTPRHPEAPLHLAGFHLPAKHKGPGKGQCQPSPEHSPGPEQSDQFGSFLYWRPPLPSIEEELRELNAQAISASPGDGASAGEEEEDEEDSDEEGWITPSNLKQAQQDMGHCDTAPAEVQVGCVTTDFAMQNVLLQMGLPVLAVNGMLIRQARSYILRCHGCFRTTSDMSKVFCPHCGNKTLKKVAVSVSNDGSLHMHFSRNPKVLNPRGLRYPLPAPQGGKHANNPHLVEDQRFPQQRLSRKARQKTNVFDPDYVAGVSPFAEHDVHSRAANLHIRDTALGAGRRRLNPNAVARKFGQRR